MRAEKQRRSACHFTVSAIVPNFNHAQFIERRLQSILNQTYRNIEVIVLDDASSDNSIAIIERLAQNTDVDVRLIKNEANSGSVFAQWEKGVRAARGDLVWICESDDFCELDFLEHLAPAFVDPSVMIAFGRIQFTDASGTPYDGLDDYRERAERGIWNRPLCRPAKTWFHGGFGVANVIPNVGGCLIRNQPIASNVWEQARSFRILGDWFLYGIFAQGGQICYIPEAISYFRQHGSNTSVTGYQAAVYYKEHERLLIFLKERWGVPDIVVGRFQALLQRQFDYSQAARTLGDLTSVFNAQDIIATKRRVCHVLFVTLGFYLGGGEILPIHLANAMLERGYVVSFLVLQSDSWNDGIRALLDRRIAVYEASFVRHVGPDKFLEAAGIDIVHSHFIGGEGLFFVDSARPVEIPYVVTLHGSYEVIPMQPDFFRVVVSRVTHWVYVARKNLAHIQSLGALLAPGEPWSYVPNAMPKDPRMFERTRQELGIAPTEIVFALVSRALPEKGWEAAITALSKAQMKSSRRLRLLLVGDGSEADRLGPQHRGNEAVLFMGFQERVSGIYRLSDCALLPTRFLGESFPLTLIQALQVGKPIISTSIGEIPSMVVHEGLRAGVLIEPLLDDTAFIVKVSEAMLEMIDDDARAAFARSADILGASYSVDAMADAYTDVYRTAIGCFKAASAARSNLLRAAE